MFKIKQYQKNNLPFDKIDIFIGATGFEERSIYQANLLLDKISYGVILGFENEKENSIRKSNDKFFLSNDFEIIESKVEEYRNNSLVRIAFEIKQIALSKKRVNVYIDYSSMTKNWYSYIIYEIFNSNIRHKINLYLGYSHAKYKKSSDKKTYNRVVSPLFGYCNLSIPSKPTSIIIGLGNESNRVFGLKEYFDAIPYIFHSDDSYNKEFSIDAKNLLESILTQIPSKNIFEFPINDLLFSNYILENLCKELIKSSRVIIAPCGPKPFGVLAMLLSLKYDNMIEVWRITPGLKLPITNRIPTGLISTLELKFE